MDENLSPHFMRSEFELDGPMPDSCVASYTALCRFLEVIRTQFGANPIVITSGYRDAAQNALIHGVPNSQHIATAEWCAADFYIELWYKNMRPIFDWLREKSQVDFDQIILEHGVEGDIIHISWVAGVARRMALEGATNNTTGYTDWVVTPLEAV